MTGSVTCTIDTATPAGHLGPFPPGLDAQTVPGDADASISLPPPDHYHEVPVSDSVWFYLDESGPFRDRQRGDHWPISVVGGLMSFHALGNRDMRPLLDRICRFGGHNLRDQDLHARELRDQLGRKYDDWMIHALRSIDTLGDDVRCVCFRSSERLSLGDTDTNYLNLLIEGLVRVIPVLIARSGNRPLRVNIVLENRRVTGKSEHSPRSRPTHDGRDDDGEWEQRYVGRRDRSVPRASYVALEDYATRLRTRLLVELTRRGLGRKISMLRDISIKISDPATDKALNYADFISHQARYADRGSDARVFAESLEPLMAFDIDLVLHHGVEAAERKIEERRYGEAMFDLIETVQETDSKTVKEAALKRVTQVVAAMDELPARLIERHIHEFFESVNDLDLLHPDHTGAGADNPTAYLRVLDIQARERLGSMDDGDGWHREQARSRAWRWGLFRCHAELLRMANHRGDANAAAEARKVCEPLIPGFARSTDHQPIVFDYLLRVCRSEILGGKTATAIGRLDKLIAFHTDTEDWWSVDLPTVLPAVGKLDRQSILCRPLGLALHMRGLARLAAQWPAGKALARSKPLKAALQDLTAALDEYVTPGDRLEVCADLATLHALAGSPDEALGWLARPLTPDAEEALERLRRGETAVLTDMADRLLEDAGAASATGALLETLARIGRDEPGKTDPVSAGVRNALDAAGVARLVAQLESEASGAALRAIALVRSRARCLAAWGGMDVANGLFGKAAGMCRASGRKGNGPVAWLAAGIQLDMAAWTRKRKGALQAAHKSAQTALKDWVHHDAAHALTREMEAQLQERQVDVDWVRQAADRIALW